MQISVNQINQNELTLFIQQTASGSALSGSMQAYFAASGWVGNTVLYTTGGIQSVTGVKTFLDAPIVPTNGSSLTAANKSYVSTQIDTNINLLSGYTVTNFVSSLANQTISGRKIFTGALGVGSPVSSGDAVNLGYVTGVSGALQSSLSAITIANVLYTSGTQTVSGTKIYTASPLVPIPTDASGAVPKSYVDALSITGVVYTTGAQTISGVKTFLNSPVIPVGTATNHPVTLAQLQGTAFNYAPTSGYSVTSLNGVTGGILTQGANGITTYMCDNILYVSGNAATSSLIYSAQLPLASGATGVSFVWGTGFSSKPTVTTSLEITGTAPLFFVSTNLYNVNTGGFNVAFQSGIPHSSYVLNFNAMPTISGSGFFGVRGEQGQAQPTWNPRGNWQIGVSYSKYDFVYQPSSATSYVALTGHNSDSFNQPVSTGNAYWSLVASGQKGDVGATGAIGYFINSGIITGNFYTISFFLNPVGTGLNLAETFVATSFNMTGYKLGCVASGTNQLLGGVLTGKFYTRDDNNNKITLQDFTFGLGRYTYFSGGLGVPITGGNRIGVDITNTVSGIEGLSLGVFGF